MSDRRRINGPSSGTQTAIFVEKPTSISVTQRARKPNELRRIFLQPGVIATASGSAYLELEVPVKQRNFLPATSTLKLCCSVHGPKPLDRNSNFSPNLQLTASIKFAPFATRKRRGYVRDNVERDLGSHLENALKGVIIPERWPKSAIEVAVVVLEGEEDCLRSNGIDEGNGIGSVGLMNVLAGSITVSSAALADANIDCLDMVAGGVAARAAGEVVEYLDPCPSEHSQLISVSVVGYLPSRDEVTELWVKNSATNGTVASIENLTDLAVKAARGAHKILREVVLESCQQSSDPGSKVSPNNTSDVEMRT